MKKEIDKKKKKKVGRLNAYYFVGVIMGAHLKMLQRPTSRQMNRALKEGV